jgi:hypothetical protein
MRNRAMCKLCGDIIESFHRHDYVKCTCDQIMVDGGNDYFRCGAVDWDNFIRLDDDDNQVPIQVKEKEQGNIDQQTPSDTGLAENISHKEMSEISDQPLIDKKKSILNDIDQLCKVIEGLPHHALDQPITHRDYLSLLGLISSVLKLS